MNVVIFVSTVLGERGGEGVVSWEGQTELYYYAGNKSLKIDLRRGPEECSQVNWEQKQNKTKISVSR